MFGSCYILKTVPLFNTESAIFMLSMFSDCYALEEIPAFNTASVTDMSSMFDSCYNLRAIPALVMNNVTDASSIYNSCFALERNSSTGLKFSHSYLDCIVSANEMEIIFTNLGTAVGESIEMLPTVCNQSIAINKGWTITIFVA